MSLFQKYLLAFLLLAQISFAQEKHFINGVIGIQGGEIYSYDMTLYSTTNPYEFKGTVKTYALINKEVTAEVILTIDPAKKTGRLLETRILDNKGFTSSSTICLVDAALTYDDKNGVLKGPIITQTKGDQAYCAIGNVTFTSTTELQKIFNISPTVTTTEPVATTTPSAPPQSQNRTSPPINQPSTTRTPTPQTSVQPEPVKNPEAIKEVTSGKDAVIEWTSDKIILEIWDDNKIDGDRISIFFNNKEILYNYQLTAEHKRLEFDINGQELNIITIVAMSEGSEPPNTAMIHLTDGEKKPLKILSHNVAGKSAHIRIKKKL